jgi:lactate dehydrogenase-like 2-hydroxyacid dehydrogenase
MIALGIPRGVYERYYRARVNEQTFDHINRKPPFPEHKKLGIVGAAEIEEATD